MNLPDIREGITVFFKTDQYFKEFLPDDFNDMTSLRDLGLFDSLSVVSIVSFVETQYSVEFAVPDINETNFDSVDSLSRYVFEKLNEKRQIS